MWSKFHSNPSDNCWAISLCTMHIMHWMADIFTPRAVLLARPRMYSFPIWAVQMISRLSELWFLIETDIEVHDTVSDDSFKWWVCLNTGCHIVLQVPGTYPREWLCLSLSLFVSYYCFSPPAAHSQWEPGPGRSSPSSSPLFTTPNPFLCIQNIPRRKTIFALKRYLIHCFPGLTLQHH